MGETGAMDDNTAIFIIVMTAIIIPAYLIALWIKYRRPAGGGAEDGRAEQEEARRDLRRE